MRLKIFTILAIVSSISCSNAQEISVHDAWIRSAPASAQVVAAFMKIENPGSTEVHLLRAEAADYASVELHRTQMEDGMMKMIKQPNIPIPAKGHVMLKPGSWHIMLIKPNKVPSEGEEVMLNLHFDNGTQVEVKAIVKADNNAMHSDHNQHK